MFSSYRKLKALVAELRAANFELQKRCAMYASMNGAGPPGQANCDGEWIRKFEALDREYRALEKLFYERNTDSVIASRFRELINWVKN